MFYVLSKSRYSQPFPWCVRLAILHSSGFLAGALHVRHGDKEREAALREAEAAGAKVALRDLRRRQQPLGQGHLF